jgi:hypothetical protein
MLIRIGQEDSIVRRQPCGYVPSEGKPDRALSSMFIHGGWLHLPQARAHPASAAGLDKGR